MMGPNKTPCYNCTDREPGCHSVCEKYRDYKDRVNQIKEPKEAGRDADDVLYRRRRPR